MTEHDTEAIAQETEPTEEIDAAVASTPRNHALTSVDTLLDKVDDPELVSEIKKVRSRIKELDRNRENAVTRLKRLHEAAGRFLQGMRDKEERKCFFCGNAAVQHEPWCIAWAIIDWRDGNHNQGAKKAEKQSFENSDRPVDQIADETPDNRRWDENVDQNKAAYTETLI